MMKKRLIVFGAILFAGLAVGQGASAVVTDTDKELYAQEAIDSRPAADGGIGSDDPRARAFQLVTCTGVVDPRTNQGKECDYAQLVAMVGRIVKYILYLITFIVLAMIFITGFKYVTANGEPRKLESAKRMIMPIIIGVFLVFSGWLIVYTILDHFLADQIGDVQKSSIVPTKR